MSVFVCGTVATIFVCLFVFWKSTLKYHKYHMLYIKSTVVLPFLDKYHDTPNFIQEPYVNISVREVFGDMQFIKVYHATASAWYF